MNFDTHVDLIKTIEQKFNLENDLRIILSIVTALKNNDKNGIKYLPVCDTRIAHGIQKTLLSMFEDANT